jgi:hypothetical protein
MAFYYAYSALQMRRLLVKDRLIQISALGSCGLVILAPLLVAMIFEGIGNERAYAAGIIPMWLTC